MPVPKSSNQPVFNDEITIDSLLRSHDVYRKLVEEVALCEINSIQTAMPVFNTVATLNKTEFNMFMRRLLYKQYNEDKKLFISMAAGVLDTFACVMDNSRFYRSYCDKNKDGLQLMIQLLQTIKYLVICSKVMDNKQLKILIGIIEKSVKRIKTEQNDYKIIEEILQTLQTELRSNEDKENNIEIPCVGNVSPVSSAFITLCDKNQNLNHIVSKESLRKISSETSMHFMAKETNDEVTTKTRTVNAFEVMMLSSKQLTKKRKLAV